MKEGDVEVRRHSYVGSDHIARLPYVTLSCSILSCHVRYFLIIPVKQRYRYWQLVASYHPVNFTDLFTVQLSIVNARDAMPPKSPVGMLSQQSSKDLFISS